MNEIDVEFIWFFTVGVYLAVLVVAVLCGYFLNKTISRIDKLELFQEQDDALFRKILEQLACHTRLHKGHGKVDDAAGEWMQSLQNRLERLEDAQRAPVTTTPAPNEFVDTVMKVS